MYDEMFSFMILHSQQVGVARVTMQIYLDSENVPVVGRHGIG